MWCEVNSKLNLIVVTESSAQQIEKTVMKSCKLNLEVTRNMQSLESDQTKFGNQQS